MIVTFQVKSRYYTILGNESIPKSTVLPTAATAVDEWVWLSMDGHAGLSPPRNPPTTTRPPAASNVHKLSQICAAADKLRPELNIIPEIFITWRIIKLHTSGGATATAANTVPPCIYSRLQTGGFIYLLVTRRRVQPSRRRRYTSGRPRGMVPITLLHM